MRFARRAGGGGSARRSESATSSGPSRRRLGVYVDAPFRSTQSDGGRVATDSAAFGFLLFASEVGRNFDAVVFFGRKASSDDPAVVHGLPEGVQLAKLAHYSSLRRLREVARAAIGTFSGMWAGLSRVDLVWVFGPHPFAVLLVALALLRRKQVVLGVRQDTVEYYRGRLPSRWWRPALVPIRVLDLTYRLLARRLRATVVGPELARRYGDSRVVLPMIVSLVRAADVAAAPAPADWNGTIDLLTVGRLEPEKNPLLLVDVLALLEAEEPGRFRLTWAGDGRLSEAVAARAAQLRVAHLVDLRGFVPFGDELYRLYRSAHAFVHVSLTEGVPQVLIEALAAGLPVVATDVGGVRYVLDGGSAGLLVPPADPRALVGAITEISRDATLRARLANRALTVARELTLESQARRVAAFLEDQDPEA
jgi:glycosyltransferase involved in cell wall biosynthesis